MHICMHIIHLKNTISKVNYLNSFVKIIIIMLFIFFIGKLGFALKENKKNNNN